jgi:hypothetical protein
MDPRFRGDDDLISIERLALELASKHGSRVRADESNHEIRDAADYGDLDCDTQDCHGEPKNDSEYDAANYERYAEKEDGAQHC